MRVATGARPRAANRQGEHLTFVTGAAAACFFSVPPLILRVSQRMSTSREPVTTAAQLTVAASFLAASYFLAFDAGEYLRNFTATVYGRFWAVRNWMLLHIAAGTIALILGAVQFCLAFLRRTSAAHRWTGRVYVGTVLVSCVASLVVLRNGSVLGRTWVALLVVLSACALLFTAFGLIEARRRRWQHHAAWMLRSYMAMMVFAWFRLAWELPVLRDLTVRPRATTILALTMAITFAGTELLLRSRLHTARHRLGATVQRSTIPQSGR
jgi:hypothetical protein